MRVRATFDVRFIRPPLCAALSVFWMSCSDGAASTAPEEEEPQPPTVVRIDVTPKDQTVDALGVEIAFTSVARDAAGAQIAGLPISWSSSDVSVIAINEETGVAVTTGNGTARVSASAAGVTAGVDVTVAQVVAALSLSPPDGLWMTSQSTRQASAHGTDRLGSPVAGLSVTWSSSDESVASVTETGLVSAVGNGEAVLSATAGGLVAQSEVVVSTPLPLQQCKLTGDGDEATPSPQAEWYLDRTVGVIRAIMLFVDFSDAPASETTELVHLLNVPTAVAWFDEVSYGRMELDVTAVHTWYRMPKPSAEYYPYSEYPHVQVFQDAMDVADADVDFSQYDLIYVMSSADSAILGSPSFNRPPGQGAVADGHELRNGTAIDGMRPWPPTQLDRYAFSLMHENA